MPENTSPKTVLVVDDEKLFLASLTEGMMEFADEFTMITALNGKKALEELKKQEVHLVVTDLKMPVMDGFQLLTHMMHEFPHIPIIVMTAFCTPEIERRVQDLDAFKLLEKPIDLQLLASKIREGIQHGSEGHLKGIMLFSFLQLIEMEKKTCNLKVRSNGRKGNLYFSKGTLIDAVCGELTGLEAAYEIVCWEDAEIEIMNVFKKIRKRIEKPLQNILMDAAKEKDEASILGLNDDDVFDSAHTDFVQVPDQHADEIAPANVHFDGATETGDCISETPSTPNQQEFKISMANNIQDSLNELLKLDGAMAAALVDSDSGMALGTAGGGVNLDVAAAGNTEVIKSKYKVMGNLGLKDRIEDILISLGSQYHLIRPLTNHNNLFFYLVLGREKSNLAMARFKLNEIESDVQL